VTESTPPSNDPMQRFYARVWRENVVPHLKDRHAEQRRRTAAAGTRVASATGRALDSLLKLRGKPFQRSMTVLGARLGALLPDVWDWRWFREEASPETRRAVKEAVAREARYGSVEEACGLLGVRWPPSEEVLQEAWRRVAYECHPDRARSAEERHERELRFVACQAAYEAIKAELAARGDRGAKL
jgi:hypothetical protein